MPATGAPSAASIARLPQRFAATASAATVTIHPTRRTSTRSLTAAALAAALRLGDDPSVLPGMVVASVMVLLLESPDQFHYPIYGMLLFPPTFAIAGYKKRHNPRWIAPQGKAKPALSQTETAHLNFVLALVISILVPEVLILTKAVATVQQIPWAAALHTHPLPALVVAANAGACAYILAEQLRIRRNRHASRIAGRKP
jgi:hypothetical protein